MKRAGNQNQFQAQEVEPQASMYGYPNGNILGQSAIRAPVPSRAGIPKAQPRTTFCSDRVVTTEIAKQIREARVAFGLTQKDVAGLSNTGVRFIVDAEKGKPTMELGKLVDVLVTLGLTLRVVNIQAERIAAERAETLASLGNLNDWAACGARHF